MTFAAFVERARTKSNFQYIEDYLDFADQFLSERGTFIVAEIICQNETDYRFWQLPAQAGFAISRPLNATLLCEPNELALFRSDVLPGMPDRSFMTGLSRDYRSLLNRVIYTAQQCIGIALDGLPGSNSARKINGDLFERQIQLWLRRMSVDCTSATVRVPVTIDGVTHCKMNFQHDLVISNDESVKIIGSVKTSSKDRLGKVFVDKMLLASLTGKIVPHIAIFLNDVQRGARTPRSYKVSSTFLPGHFKAFTIKLNPLDGVFYCDLRPNMATDPILNAHISRIDSLLCDDLWQLLDREVDLPIRVAAADEPAED